MEDYNSMKIARKWQRERHSMFRAILAFAAGLALAGCAGSTRSSSSSSSSTAEGLLGLHANSAGSGQGLRELTLPEKKVISDAVGLSIKDPGTAQFRWPQISAAGDGAVNYCGMVNAKSPFPAYNGWQAYIVEANVSGGKVSSAVVGLIAGGKDVEIVRKMCRKYELDPGGAG
jgi:hypothetical protein